MKIKKLFKQLKYSINPPCPKCPYTLGLVKFVVSPCPECKANNYHMYQELKKGRYGKPEIVEKED